MENGVAKTIKIVGILEMLAGFIIGYFLGNEGTGYSSEMHESVFIYWVIIGFVSGMLFIGFSEVIQLLHNINEKLRKKFDTTEGDKELIEKFTANKGNKSKYEQWQEHYENKKDM